MKRFLEHSVEVRSVAYEEEHKDDFFVPDSRYAHSMVCVDDYFENEHEDGYESDEFETPKRGIFTFGGYGNGAFMKDLNFFDVQTKHWNVWYPKSPSIRTAREFFVEYSRSRHHNSFEWFSKTNSGPTFEEPDIRKRANHSCIVRFDPTTQHYKLVFFGGMGTSFLGNHGSEVLEYCCAAKQWKQLTFFKKCAIPVVEEQVDTNCLAKFKRSAHVFLYISHLDKLYIHGGHAMEVYYDDLIEIDLKTNTWEMITLATDTKPSARCVHLGLIHALNKFVVCFGVCGLARFNDMYEYDILKKEWTQIQYQNAPCKRGATRGVMVGPDTLFLFGGRQENFEQDKLNDFYLFHFKTRIWTKLELSFPFSYLPKGISSYGMAQLSMYSSNSHYQLTRYQSIQYFKLYSKIYIFAGNTMGDAVTNDFVEIIIESPEMLQTKYRLFHSVFHQFADVSLFFVQ